MNIDKILNGKKYKSILDSSCDEFGRSSIEEKLIQLASLNFYNLIEEFIKLHKTKYKESKDQYIIDNLIPTLQRLINHLQEENSHPSRNKMSKNIKSTLKVLKSELENKVQTNYSIDSLLRAYLAEDETTFQHQNRFFQIDFSEDQTANLKLRDSNENREEQESYTRLYTFLHNHLIPNFKNKNFIEYSVDMGMDYQTEYVVNFFLSSPSQESYFNAIKYVVNIIYLGKKPYHKFFLFRVNFDDKGLVKDFHEKNLVAVRFNTEKDFKDWEEIQKNGKPKQQFAQRFKTILENTAKEDVIVIASFKGIGTKVGVIREGTENKTIGDDRDFYSTIQLRDLKDIDIDKFPFVQTLLPSNVTISPINRKNYTLRKKIYPQVKVQITNNELDDLACEIIATEWLRSKYAPKEHQLKYQLLKTGGNKKDIDIYGMTCQNQKLIGQVSATSNPKTIEKKIDKLKKYNGFKQVFFFNIPSQKTSEYEIINLERVLSDFRKDQDYSKLLKELE